MAYKDDTKTALAVLKLAEAQRRLLILLDTYLLFNEEDGAHIRDIRMLIASAEKDARGVDNGALRDYEVNP